MSDQLKEIFNQHKEELFPEKLSSNHLSKFEEKLDLAFGKEKKIAKNWMYYSGIAASVALFITVGILFYNPKPEINSNFAQTEVQESEDFFALAVENKIRALKQYETPRTKPHIDKCLETLNRLDKDYTDLKKDFQETGNDQLMSLMLNNLKKRVDIIEELIEQLEHYKNQGYEL